MFSSVLKVFYVKLYVHSLVDKLNSYQMFSLAERNVRYTIYKTYKKAKKLKKNENEDTLEALGFS